MKVAIISAGAIVVQHKDNSWLFGAPDGIREALDTAGIDVPGVLFTTSLRAPGYGKLGKPVLRYKESPLKMNGLTAVPIYNTHGTDFLIETDDGSKVLFSERGDVSADATKDYSLAIIKNKHSANGYGDNVIHWPWPDAEYNIVAGQAVPLQAQVSYKVWSDIKDVPDNIKTMDGTALTLDQANQVVKVAKAAGADGKENWAIGISSFKKGHKKEDGKWVKKQEDTAEKEEIIEETAVVPGIPTALKELAPGIPDNIDGRWASIYKDNDGNDRWASISSVAVWDNQGELFTTKAMDWAIAFSKLTEFKGPLRYRHIPGLDGGYCDTQVRVGDFLFESGTFNDTPIGLAMKQAYQDTPEDWKISLGLAYAKDDLVGGVYDRAAIFERSMTKMPALPVTVFSMKELIDMKIMTEQELKDAASELKMEFTEVKTMYERALANGNLFASKEEFQTALKAGATQDTKSEEDLDELVTKEDLVEVLKGLTEEDWKELEDALEEVVSLKADGKKKKSDMMDEEDEEPDGDEAMTGKSTKEDRRIDRLENLVLKQAETINEIATALKAGTPQQKSESDRTDLSKALAEMFKPRDDARTAHKEQATELADADILAQLKQIVDQQTQTKQGKGGIYDTFTSRELNKTA